MMQRRAEVLVRLNRPVWNYDSLKEVLGCAGIREDETFDNFKTFLNDLFTKVKNHTITSPEQFYTKVIPRLALWANLFPEIPLGFLLCKGKTECRTLTSLEIAFILSNSFFCAWQTNPTNRNAINFQLLYHHCSQPQEGAKLLCILNYFGRITQLEDRELAKRKLTFKRQVLQNAIDWVNSNKRLCNFMVHRTGSIEELHHSRQVIFGNRLVGGGVISGGCVQEEIKFALFPEMLAACLFTEDLQENESLVVRGAEQYSKTSGYSFSLQFSSNYFDETERDQTGHLKNESVCMDAIDFRQFHTSLQYSDKAILRELSKAFIAFVDQDPSVGNFNVNLRPIATGNWGCGAFLGDLQHKCIIQWMAASQANATLQFFPFGERKLQSLEKVTTALLEKNLTIAALYKILQAYKQHLQTSTQSFFSFLNDTLSLDIL